MPYIEQSALYNQIDFNFHAETDGAAPDPAPTNLTLFRAQKIDGFNCPSDLPFPGTSTSNNYCVSTGSHFNAWSLPNDAATWTGFFHRRFVTRMRDAIDGTSNSIMMGEVLHGDNTGTVFTPNTDVPRGVAYAGTNKLKPTMAELETYGVSCLAGSGNHTSFSGSNFYRSMMLESGFNTVATPNWKYPNCNTCAGCGSGDNDGVYPARSRHTGGAQHLLGDGTVHFISDNIDLGVYQNLGTVKGGEVVSFP